VARKRPRMPTYTPAANANAGDPFAGDPIVEKSVEAAFTTDVSSADALSASEPLAAHPRQAPAQRWRAVPAEIVRARDAVPANASAHGGEHRSALSAPQQQPVVNIGTIDVRITQAAPAPPPPVVVHAPAPPAPAPAGTLARGYGSALGLRQQ
jgi:hypothetical protein